MALSNCSATLTTDVGSIETLRNAIALRSKVLRESTAEATAAAAIWVLRSLKAATPKSPYKARPEMYEIKETGLVGGLRKVGDTVSVCARIGDVHGHVSPIRPAIGFKPGSRSVLRSKVYAIYSTNPYDTFSKNVNAPAKCWYVLCENIGQAEEYAKNHIGRILSKESGMAKYTLGIAQAQASTHSGKLVSKEAAGGNGGMSPRAAKIAYDASSLTVSGVGFSSGKISIDFFDKLRYSLPAAGGDGALSDAVDKASRSMLAYAERMAAKAFPVSKTDINFNSSKEVQFA